MRNCVIWGLLLLLANGALADPSARSIPLKSIGTETFYIDSHISGYGALSMLVDTGSGYSALNQAALKRLKAAGNAEYVKDLRGIMADGSEMVVPVYRVKGITVGSKCLIEDVEVAIFPAKSRPIIGLNTLRKMAPFAFSFDPPSLMLSNCALADSPRRSYESTSALDLQGGARGNLGEEPMQPKPQT